MARLLKVQLRPGYYHSAVVGTLAPLVLGVILLVCWFLFGSPGIHIGSSFSIPYGLFLLVGMGIYCGASCFFTDTEEFVGVTVFNVPAIVRTGGFLYAPLWITQRHLFPRAQQEDQFPGEPEQISHMPDEEADRTKSLLLEPIRITTGGPEQGPDADSFKDDILNERLTLEPSIVVFWQLELNPDPNNPNDGGFFDFYVNMPGKTWYEKYRAVLKRMRDTAEGALNIEMSKHSAAWAIANKEELTRLVATKIAQAVQDWGIIVCEVDILNLVPHRSVNVALGTIPEAKARSQAATISAEGEKNATITVAKGKAEAIKIVQTADGEGLKAYSDASGVSAEKILKVRAAVKIGKNGKNINLGGDLLRAAENMLGA